MLGLIKSRKLWKDTIGKEYKLSILNWGDLSKACSLRCLCVPFSSQIRMLLAIGRAPLTGRFYDLLQGKSHAIPQIIVHLKYSICQGAIVWGGVS